jgi:predicted metal-dependent HD superfamily phosphohydrolase
MATRHHAVPSGIDARILVDADLAILAAPWDRFHEYEQQIRTEYAHVSSPYFAARRKEILEQFLRRDRIFATSAFHDRYEQAARRNLRQAIGA